MAAKFTASDFEDAIEACYAWRTISSKPWMLLRLLPAKRYRNGLRLLGTRRNRSLNGQHSGGWVSSSGVTHKRKRVCTMMAMREKMSLLIAKPLWHNFLPNMHLYTWDNNGIEMKPAGGFLIFNQCPFWLIPMTHDESTFFANDERKMLMGSQGSESISREKRRWDITHDLWFFDIWVGLVDTRGKS